MWWWWKKVEVWSVTLQSASHEIPVLRAAINKNFWGGFFFQPLLKSRSPKVSWIYEFLTKKKKKLLPFYQKTKKIRND